MRGVLHGWLVEVHLKFRLLPETLYIAINIIDRYSERRYVSRMDYQLLGITAMLIASKYEERYPPDVGDFVHITDNTYTKQQLLNLEFQVLKVLDFELTFPTCFRFLERFAQVAQADGLVYNLAYYLQELTIIDSHMKQFAPSKIAAASIYFARKML